MSAFSRSSLRSRLKSELRSDEAGEISGDRPRPSEESDELGELDDLVPLMGHGNTSGASIGASVGRRVGARVGLGAKAATGICHISPLCGDG